MNKKQELELKNEQEQEAAEYAAFMDEVDRYLATLPKPSPEDLKQYQEKVDFLGIIHAEIDAKRGDVKEPVDDWEPDSRLEEKYLYQYRLGTL